MRRLRAARLLSDSWWQQIRDDPEGRVGRLLAASLQAAATTALDALHEGVDPPDPRDLHYLARAIRDASAAEDSAVRREEWITTRARAEAAEAARAATRRHGVSEAVAAAIVAEIEGAA